MAAPDFWTDTGKAQKVSAEATSIRRKMEQMRDLEKRIADLPVHQELAEEDGSEAARKEFAEEMQKALAQLDH